MKVRCFADTDSLWIALRDAAAAETRDLDDDTLIDLDADACARSRWNAPPSEPLSPA